MKPCKVCGCEIPAARIKALPHTQTCVQHSDVSRFSVNIVQIGTLEGDGYQEVEIVRDPKAMEQLKYYKDQQGRYQ